MYYNSIYDVRQNGIGIAYNQERVRLESFKPFEKWPHKHISPKTLAKIGFYYKGAPDIVRCFACHVTLKDWANVDDVVCEKKEWSPHCPMLFNSGNIPLQPVQELDVLIPPIKLRSAGIVNLNAKRLPIMLRTVLNLDEVTALYPYLQPYAQRMHTFVGWDSFSMDSLHIKRMVEAGFFAISQDTVACYFCGGQLTNWNKMDDPLEMHIFWFGRQCELMKSSYPELIMPIQKRLKRASPPFLPIS